MDRKSSLSNEKKYYQVTIEGQLHEKWAQWLSGMIINIHKNPNNTVFSLAVQDQAALRGILNKLWDLNLTIISVIQHEKSTN